MENTTRAKFQLQFNANGTWIRVNDDVVSEGAALAMLNGYVLLNGWVDADKADKYRIISTASDECIVVY